MSIRPLALPLVLALLATLACRSPVAGSVAGPGVGPSQVGDEAAIGTLLDGWHRAAARADGRGYLGLLAKDAVYLGTDARERWTRSEFEAFCEPYFARGIGWTYEPRERHVRVLGDLGWFDERLWNDKYGECRGTGVLRRAGSSWEIVHYSLTLPVPNELASEVVRLIRGG